MLVGYSCRGQGGQELQFVDHLLDVPERRQVNVIRATVNINVMESRAMFRMDMGVWTLRRLRQRPCTRSMLFELTNKIDRSSCDSFKGIASTITAIVYDNIVHAWTPKVRKSTTQDTSQEPNMSLSYILFGSR